MQSVDGVIWSVSIASSFCPGTLGSQKISAFPRMAGSAGAAFSAPIVANDALVAPGRRRAGWTVCTTLSSSHAPGGRDLGIGMPVEAVRREARTGSRRALASPDFSLLVFGGLTLASVPVRLQGGPASALAYWTIASVLGTALVAIYHLPRER